MFSGIGGFDAAAERCGMTVAWQVEVDRFARRVLKHHWPGVEQHGDVRTVDPGRIGAVDVLCGGWPCQGNSVAGKRGGHGDERSGLFSQILRLIDGMAPRPAFLVLENVPGLVSVNERRDFADVIGELRGRGYVGCVRVLDAQYFGLAQRRKRLLFVAGLGAAGVRAVQLVLEGGRRYPAPRRPEGQTAPALAASGAGTGRTGNERTEDGFLVTAPVCSKWAKGTGGPAGDEAQNLIAHTLRADGFDASEDGTGRGTPLVIQEGQTGCRLYENAGCLRADAPGTQPTGSLVAFGISNDPTPKFADGLMPTLQTKNGQHGQSGGRMEAVAFGASVRRLTPTECERLQGFPDGWTCLCGRNAGRSWPEEDACRCPDGPRYRSLGNAIAVPVGEWVLRCVLEASDPARTPAAPPGPGASR